MVLKLIGVEEDAKLILDGIKIHQRETYNDIIYRLLENKYHEEKLNKILKEMKEKQDGI